LFVVLELFPCPKIPNRGTLIAGDEKAPALASRHRGAAIMRRRVGIAYHYPPLSKFERWYLLGVPVAVVAVYELDLVRVPTLGPWVGALVGLFALSWAVLVLQRIVREFEKSAYQAAMDDVTVVLSALFREAQTEDEVTVFDLNNRIGAALLSLRLSQPENDESQNA
jgi:hypothetical protein